MMKKAVIIIALLAIAFFNVFATCGGSVSGSVSVEVDWNLDGLLNCSNDDDVKQWIFAVENLQASIDELDTLWNSALTTLSTKLDVDADVDAIVTKLEDAVTSYTTCSWTLTCNFSIEAEANVSGSANNDEASFLADASASASGSCDGGWTCTDYTDVQAPFDSPESIADVEVVIAELKAIQEAADGLDAKYRYLNSTGYSVIESQLTAAFTECPAALVTGETSQALQEISATFDEVKAGWTDASVILDGSADIIVAFESN